MASTRWLISDSTTKANGVVMDEENWDEGWLTLAVHDREEKGSLLMVYEEWGGESCADGTLSGQDSQ